MVQQISCRIMKGGARGGRNTKKKEEGLVKRERERESVATILT